MVLDRSKTIKLLTATVLETGEELSITADNLDEISLVIIGKGKNKTVLVENDSCTQFDIDELSDMELEYFYAEYDVQPIYDIDKSVDELRKYLISQIKPFEYDDGVITPYVHCPDNIEDYVRVHYINNSNEICIDDPYSPGEIGVYRLCDLYIDDLLKIIKMQSNETITK